jgi:hypothetical protein
VTLEVRDSSTGEAIASAHGRLGTDTGLLSVTDAQGRHLAINKWSRLSPTFENADDSLRDRVLDAAQRLASDLHQLGVTAYICSGTLLGAVRTGHILPHDDDVDFGVLARATHPVDIVLEGYALEEALHDLGYATFRHSGAHLQVLFTGTGGGPDFYMDIFTSFFRDDGTFNQPFHLRQTMMRSAIAPTSEVQLEGRTFASPANPGAWLSACYGVSWQTPDPSFRFVTPRSTYHRFDSWFGVMDGGSEKNHARIPQHHDLPNIAKALRRVLPQTAPLVCLECGEAMASAKFRSGRRIIATDTNPMVVAQAKPREGVTCRAVNPSERRRMLELGAMLVRDGSAWWIAVVRDIEHLTPEARQNTLLLAQLALEPEGRLVLNVSRSHADQLALDAAKYDLHVDTVIPVIRVPGTSSHILLTFARQEGATP